MEEDIKNMSKEELLEYLEEISQQLDNIALDQIQFAISELQFFKEDYKKLEENKKLANANAIYIKSIQSITPVLTNDYIEKSVIEEKKEELNNKLEVLDGVDYFYVMEEIDILDKILEEGRK